MEESLWTVRAAATYGQIASHMFSNAAEADMITENLEISDILWMQDKLAEIQYFKTCFFE